MDALTFGVVVNVVGMAYITFYVCNELIECFYEVKNVPAEAQKLNEEFFAITFASGISNTVKGIAVSFQDRKDIALDLSRIVRTPT